MSSVQRLDAADPDHLALAVRALQEGRVVAVPTDTVYGLAADPTQPAAVARVFQVKERPVDVALPVLVAGWEQVATVAAPLAGSALRLADHCWPGPLTLVVPRRAGFVADLGGPAAGRGTVGVRWPAHPTMEALCRAAGPLAVTSANPHGRPPATTADEVVEWFGRTSGGAADGAGRAEAGEADGASAGTGLLAAVLDGGVCDGTPSTVVECTGTAARCLRDGGVPWVDLEGLASG